MDNNFHCGKGRATPGSAVLDGARVISVPSKSDDEIAALKAKLNLICAATKLDAKLDRVLELTQDVVAQRTASIPSMPGVPSLAEMARSPGPSAGQLAAQWQASYEAREAQKCAESEAAYAARNPHKKERK